MAVFTPKKHASARVRCATDRLTACSFMPLSDTAPPSKPPCPASSTSVSSARLSCIVRSTAVQGAARSVSTATAVTAPIANKHLPRIRPLLSGQHTRKTVRLCLGQHRTMKAAALCGNFVRLCGIALAIVRSAVAAGRDERADGLRDVGDRHGLEPYAARTGQRGVEQALAAEQLVLDAGDLLDVDGNAGFKLQTLPVSTMSF